MRGEPAGTSGEPMSLKARITAPFRVSWPVMRRLFVDAALLIPTHAVVGAAVLWAASRLLAGRWDDVSGLAAFGGWSLSALYGVLGAAGGAIAGGLAACARTLAWLETHTEAWILDLPAGAATDGSGALSLEAVEENVDRVADAAFGRLPVPGLIRRVAKSRLRSALLDDFLTSCRDRGLTSVGHGEIRNWLLTRGLARAIEPARAQLALWRTLTFAALGLAVLIAVASSVLAGVFDPAAVVLVVCGLAGVAVIAWGLPRAALREHPGHWRTGVLILGACVAGWPAVYQWLWSRGAGLAWLAALALTWITVRRGFDEAFVRAGPARDAASTSARQEHVAPGDSAR